LNKSLLLKLVTLSFSNKLLLMEASFYTIWALFIIHLFSFKRYMNWIKNPKKNNPSEKNINLVYHTIKKINKYAFWLTTCYTQAIAARLILKRMNIKSKIHLGMIKDSDGKLTAHAWTEVENKIITGGNGNLDKYKVIYIFEE